MMRQPITLGTLVTFEVEGEAWIGHVVAIGPAGGLGCTVRAIPVRQPTPEQVQQEVFPLVRDWGCVCTRLRVLVPGMQGAPALPGSEALSDRASFLGGCMMTMLVHGGLIDPQLDFDP